MSDARVDRNAESVDLARVLHILRDRKWTIIVFAILGVAGALAFSILTTPMYHATARIMLQNTSFDRALFNSQIFQIGDQQRALITSANLITLDQVAEEVKKELQTERSVQSLQRMVSVKPSSSANVIDITVSSPDMTEPADVANSFARQFIAYRQRADQAVLANARAQVEAELKAMTPEELASARGQTLSQKVEELTVLESMQTGGYELVQAARVPTSPYNLHTTRNTAVGLVIGLVVGLLIASLVQLLDRRIKDDEGFEKEFGAPIIARVPFVGRRWGGSLRRRSSTPVGFMGQGLFTLEAFRTLRSNLKFFEVNREVKTILVTSPLPREGKSVTAVNLALSLAMSGSRVILLEADLRKPMLGRYLGFNGEPGFTNLLAGTRTVTDVVQVIATGKWVPKRNGQASSNPDGSTSTERDLLCIGAGPLPPNPAELLATDKTADVLRQLTAVCDHVVIDAPPVLLVSDALEIAKKVDGVILVARLRSTRTDEARSTRKSLERVGVKPLGVVVTGVTRARTYYTRYGDYYAKG